MKFASALILAATSASVSAWGIPESSSMGWKRFGEGYQSPSQSSKGMARMPEGLGNISERWTIKPAMITERSGPSKEAIGSAPKPEALGTLSNRWMIKPESIAERSGPTKEAIGSAPKPEALGKYEHERPSRPHERPPPPMHHGYSSKSMLDDMDHLMGGQKHQPLNFHHEPYVREPRTPYERHPAREPPAKHHDYEKPASMLPEHKPYESTAHQFQHRR